MLSHVANLLHNRWIRALLAMIGGGLATVYSYFRHVEPKQLVIERIDIPVPNLPPHLDGFTIAQLSDFHYLPHTKMPHIRRAIRMTNALAPDAIVLTGDFVNKETAAIFELSEALATLEAPHGVYAILGNHDTNLAKPYVKHIVQYGLAHHGIPLLINQSVTLANGLVFAGLDEAYNGRPNLSRALHGVSPDATVVVLVHQPDIVDYMPPDERVVLALAGHTHGGQMRVKGIRPIYLPIYGKKYIEGLFRINHFWLYVNRGIGLALLGPLRINCPPEITLLTLKAA